MKKLLALVLALTMVLALSATAFAEDVGTLEVSTVRTASGSGQEAQITVSYAGDAPLSSVRFDIESELPFDADLVEIAGAHEYNKDLGKVIIYDPVGDNLDDTVLLTINYKLDDWYDNGEYPVKITFVDATSGDEKVTLATVDGAVIIDNAYLLGDVSLDGKVDNVDLVLMARYIVKLETFNGQQMLNGDINQDGKVNNVDLVNLANYMVKLYEIIDKNA